MGIIEQIKKGEGKTIEFKEIVPSAEKLSKTVVSFANMAGGNNCCLIIRQICTKLYNTT